MGNSAFEQNGVPSQTTRVHATTAQTFADSVTTIIEFDVKDFDTPVAYDLAQNRFNPQVPGIYQIGVNVLLTPDNNDNYQVSCILNLNGALYSQTSFGHPQNQKDNVNKSHFDIIELNGSTDYVDCSLLQVSGTDLDSVPNSENVYFYAYRLV